MQGRPAVSARELTHQQRQDLHAKLRRRWPLIARWVEVDPSGWVASGYMWWCAAKRDGLDGAELATCLEQWAHFYEWRRDGETAEHGWDYTREVWTDGICYVLRRSAAEARGQDPGPWVEQWERRPDIFQRADELRQRRGRHLQGVA
jgi:hypothetical protein